MKKLLRIIVICLIFIIIFDRLTILLIRKGNGYGTDVLNFYKQPKNSIDILFLGSSHAYTAFNPYLIEEKTGLSGYVFATQQQPIWITYYYLKEALKYQTPKYVVLEVHMAIVGNDEYSEEQVNRDAIDKMKFSINKINAIKTSVSSDEDKMSYYFNIIKYHNRYKELSFTDFKTAFLGYTVDNKGYIALPNDNYIYNNSNEYNDEVEQIFPKNLEYLNKIIELSKMNNIKLILVKTPAFYTREEISKLNFLEKLAKEEDLLYLNYIKEMDKLKLDFNTDFYDSGHLSKTGSEKITLDLIKEINKK